MSVSSRTGFELELLAPPGRCRGDLASALAASIGGTLEHGLKHLMTRLDDAGAAVPCCELMPAVRVLDAAGLPFVTLVDDLSIRAELRVGAAPHRDTPSRVVMDEGRLASWVERHSFSRTPGIEHALLRLCATFDAELGAFGEGARCHPTHRLLSDLHGNPLAVVAPYGDERERVCEIVTRPLAVDERRAVLELVLGQARALGFVAPSEGSTHVHFDAAPWQTTLRFRALVESYERRRDELARVLDPNPRTSQWRGPWSSAFVELVRGAPPELPFTLLAGAIEREGVLQKNVDLNVLGVVRRRHVQPTLEARVLPVDLDASRLFDRLAVLEGFLDACLG